MDRLAGAREFLDGSLRDAAALRGNLRDLARVNRLLGGRALSRWALARLVDGSPMSVVDVGTGAADIPIAIRAGWQGPGPAPSWTAVDRRPEIVAEARAAVDAARTDITLAVADGRSLPWPDGAFEVAHASLVLHHLEPVAAVVFLRELRRVASRGVVINDLDRAPVYWLGAWLLSVACTRNPLTRHDAPLSVRRAYTLAEVGGLLRVAGLQPIAVRRAFFGHRYAVVAVPRSAS